MIRRSFLLGSEDLADAHVYACAIEAGQAAILIIGEPTNYLAAPQSINFCATTVIPLTEPRKDQRCDW